MAFSASSIFSVSAAGLYGLVMLACVLATTTAARYRQLPHHARTWAMLAAMFLLLACNRFTGFEEFVRSLLREELRVFGTYEDRRSVQGPLAVAVIVLFSAAVGWSLYFRWRTARGQRDRAVLVALGAAVVMLALVVMRIVSLHQMDTLLYGPLKLNWIADLGSSVAVLGAALKYVRLVRLRNAGRR
ncbi:hypothetical protein [Erythrobacter oryzae]|uniref:hypothetical protein n=1 Tax=Erythrobacter oryzae TaxID=3019556 RepID=UPI002557BD2C|nr:hypothetical protein [Erythrobacter sp. COR-2]